MNINIITVGRKSGHEISSLCDQYEKRLGNSIKLDWRYIDPVAGKMGRDEQKNRESEKLLDILTDSQNVVLLDETGVQLDNMQLASKFSDWQGYGKDLVFVIGGAFGVSAELKNRADFVWSLSGLVFPHEIVRLILVEQLYRTLSIINGLPYHHS